MSGSRRRKHLSRAARAQAREKAERWRQAARKADSERAARAAVFARLAPLPVPLRRDLDHLVAHTAISCAEACLKRHRAIIDRVLQVRPGLVDPPYDVGLAVLAEVPWLRSPAQWRPRGRGLSAAYHSLAEHLHATYPLSRHLWEALTFPVGSKMQVRTTMRFLASIAQGASGRELVGTPLMPAPLTRRMLHLLLNPPEPRPFVALVRRAQVLGCGGTERLARDLGEVGLDTFDGDEDYWASVIAWLCRQGPVDRKTIEQVFDYLGMRRYAGEPVTLSGRTLRSLMRERQWYERSLKARGRGRRTRYAPRDDVDMIASIATARDIADYHEGDWRITCIRTTRQLLLEGVAMRNCLAMYREVHKCGQESFWSLTYRGKRKLTIEVLNECRRIDNIAGLAQRQPRPPEVPHLLAWARANLLDDADWHDEWLEMMGAGSR